MKLECLLLLSTGEQAVIALIRKYDDARVKKDAAVMDRILADDFTSITPECSINTKARFIATFDRIRSDPRFKMLISKVGLSPNENINRHF